MNQRGLNILQVSTSDTGGGAEHIALNMHRHYLDRGHEATLAVGHKSSDDDSIVRLPDAEARGAWARIWMGVSRAIRGHEHRLGDTRGVRGVVDAIARPKAWLDRRLGREYFGYPGSSRLLELAPRPDVVHLHNLHGDYFDLRVLATLSRRVPVFITLHDAWMLSGHCAHSFDCDRWLAGCGRCPNLSAYPAVQRDATARNWRVKRDIYSRSRLHVASPSGWLLDKAEQSMLGPAMREARVIPNGIDLDIFKPGDKAMARHKLALPENALVVLVAANGLTGNEYKDAAMMRTAIEGLGERVTGRPVLCVALGEAREEAVFGRVRVRYVASQPDPGVVATYMQSADAYAHPAKADNLPTLVIEAMACGTPVVATRVGGIPELIEHGMSGMLAPAGDATLFGGYLALVLNSTDLNGSLSDQGVKRAATQHNLRTQADKYLQWYDDVLHGAQSREVRRAA